MPGLGQAPLPIADGEVGATVAVFGHPDGQDDIRVSPASIRQQVNAVGRGLYGSALVRRSVYVLAADLAPGDSGAGLVNQDGEVVGRGLRHRPRPGHHRLRPHRRGAAPHPRGQRQPRPVDTGPCLG